MTIRLLVFLFSIVVLILVIVQKKVIKWPKALLIVAALALVLYTAFLYLIPCLPALKPSGSLAVSSDMVYYRYESDIPEMLTHGNEREIPVQVWFPENLQAGKHPLLLFSPGSFGTGTSNETLYLELASRGYIVMGISHPYHSFFSDMSDGKSIMVDLDFLKSVMASQGSEDLEGTLALSKEWTQVRIDDLNLILDKILDSNIDNEYEQYIDTNRIVLSGHSLGGSVALALGRQRSEDIRALMILESPFLADITGTDGDKFVFTDEEYPLPVLHIYSDALFSKIDQITTYEMNVRLMRSDNPMYVNRHISGTGHFGLTDMILLTPVLTNMFDGGLDTRPSSETLVELNGYVLNFLEQYNK